MTKREASITLDTLMSEIQTKFTGIETPSLYDVNKVLALSTQVGQSLYLLKKEVSIEKARLEFEFDVFKAKGHTLSQELLEEETSKKPTLDAIANRFLLDNEEELKDWNEKLTEAKISLSTLESYEKYLRDCLQACRAIGDNLRFLGVE